MNKPRYVVSADRFYGDAAPSVLVLDTMRPERSVMCILHSLEDAELIVTALNLMEDLPKGMN